jgi:hypothetical protein
MRTRRLPILAAAFAFALAGALQTPALANVKSASALEAQLGVRLASTPPANARVGATFEGVVLDPAKLSARGFPGIKKNDKLLLKIVGPNNEFEIQQTGSPLRKQFKMNAQGIIDDNSRPAPLAPNAAPAVKQ